MVFLNPLLLLLLPAALLPVLIHLLNRLRYRTVRWAAVMFLITATRTSVRRARLSQILVLLARTLVILFLILALGRPLAGGWLGLNLAGPPDTVLVLLDRSASMAAIHPHQRVSKREVALRLFEEASSSGPGRVVLIENVLRNPQTLASLEGLRELSLCAPTDTAADIPAMLDSAIEYMTASRAGRTEIWLASDLQRSNWQPDRGVWQSLNTRLDAMPQDVNLRVLNLACDYQHNIAISFRDLLRNDSDTSAEGNLIVDVIRNGRTPASAKVPLVLAVNGARTAFDQALLSASVRCVRRISLGNGNGDHLKWGCLIAPPDDNPRDNTCYFAHGNPPALRAVVVAKHDLAGRIMKLSCAPTPEFSNRFCTLMTPDRWRESEDEDIGLTVWQGALPDADGQSRLGALVEAGGNLLCLPPSEVGSDAAGAEPAPDSALLGLSWGAVETASEESPYRVALWEESEGPLARTLEGHPLLVGEMVCRRRVSMIIVEDQRDHWQTMAEFSDGTPLLVRRLVGQGTIYAWATLPQAEWSSWGEGAVLVPMVQRLMRSGSQHLGNVQHGTCGEWQFEAEDIWLPVGEEVGDARWNAGVYQCDQRTLVLNRPPEEDLVEAIPVESIGELLPDVRIRVVDDLATKADTPAQSEIWWFVLCGAIAFMAIESALLIQQNVRQLSQGRTGGEAED